MSESPSPDELQHVQSVAALGYLLNAIAHDMNNLLTNLMLGADQVQYGGGKEAVDLLLEQVQRISGITRAIQRMGQRNMTANERVQPVQEVVQEFARWHAVAWPADAVTLQAGPEVFAKLSGRHFVQALSLLALGTQGEAAEPLHVSLAVEDRPRSAWVGSTETMEMAVVRLRRGTPPEGESVDFKRLVDGFFEGERSAAEVATMAAWEVVRKVRGRMRVCGDLGGGPVEVAIELPIAEPA